MLRITPTLPCNQLFPLTMAPHCNYRTIVEWRKVPSPVFRFWNLPWTNGHNTQLKWKLRYSPIHCAYWAFGTTFFRPSTLQNWPRDNKLTQSCWWLHWFVDFRADVWKNLLQVHTWLLTTQVWTEKMLNENIENRIPQCSFPLCQRALVPLLRNDRDLYATTII